MCGGNERDMTVFCVLRGIKTVLRRIPPKQLARPREKCPTTVPTSPVCFPPLFLVNLNCPKYSKRSKRRRFSNSIPQSIASCLDREGFGNMRSGHMHFPGRNRQRDGKVPSLVDLCVQTAIDNVKYIGDVGYTDSHLLERILPHCSVEELMHIENATSDRDLSPITDKLWKKYYEVKFGAKNVEIVVDRMAKKRVSFKWRQLYQAKLKEQDEVQKQSLERLAQSFKNENARKQSRQIQFIAKTPPSSKKRGFCGGFGSSSTFSNVKSNIMKKAKIEYSAEMRNRAAVKKPTVHIQRTNSLTRPPISRDKGSFPYMKFTK